MLKKISVLLVILIIIVLLFFYHSLVPRIVGRECFFDFDCRTGGCSGEVCAPAHLAGKIITTCEWPSIRGIDCGCVKGKCKFRKMTGDVNKLIEINEKDG